MAVKEKHSHYYKNVAHLKDIDAYRVLERFGVTDPSIQHAVKKLLVAGGRGAGKDQDQDVQEAIDSLQRFQEMRIEDDRETTDKALASVATLPRKAMPAAVKRDLTARKATKRATKRTTRRGR